MSSAVPLDDRGWLSLSEAARYVGVSRVLVRAAVCSGDLPAYRKPYTQQRKPTSQAQERIRISKRDLDSWVMSTWEPVVTDL